MHIARTPVASTPSSPCLTAARALPGITALLLALAWPAQAQTGTGQDDNGVAATSSTNRLGGSGTGSATTRLRTGNGSGSGDGDTETLATDRNGNGTGTDRRRDTYTPGEFERYVQQQALAAIGSAGAASRQPAQLSGNTDRANRVEPLIRRFGAELMQEDPMWPAGSVSQDPSPLLMADYLVRAGDEVQVSLWGSVEADLKLLVDRGGAITLPRVGAVQVAGVRNADLAATISRRVGQLFRNFQAAATVQRPRAVRVFVTGFVQTPGSHTVSGLSTVLHALGRAGGPSAAGSFRDIQLIRAGKPVSRLDLYDLLLKGDRAADQLVQPDDVIHVGPSGAQVGVLGSVNQQAVFEILPGETLDDVLRMAGGFNPVADRQRLAIERLSDRTTGRVAEVRLPEGGQSKLGSGDLVRVFSAISAALPRERQQKRVRIEGEVQRPGDYVLPPATTLVQAIQAAGGLTGAAYVFGTEFSRESVRQTQQDNYDRALRDLEIEMAKNQAGRRATNAEETAALTASATSSSRLIDRLRVVRPSGRVVLELSPTAEALPDLPLEDGDRINVPARGTSVGVFGSVFNVGSFLFDPNKTVEDYLLQAGGPTRGADKESIFLIRANGAVVSARQSGGLFSSGNFGGIRALPGDTLYVPEEMNKSTATQNAKDWTQILYQFGLGMAGLKSLGL